MTRPRVAEVTRRSPARRLVLGSVRAGRRAAPMHGLLTLDVTDARARLATLDPPGSFTAMVVVAVARAAAAHPPVHAYCDWRGRLVTHRYVDATVMAEVPTDRGPVALAHLLRDADQRSVADVTRELRQVTDAPDRAGRERLRRFGALTGIPGVVPGLYAALGRTRAGRARAGTVLVTAVGMFGGGAGFAIAPPGIHPLAVVVGGASTRPWVHDGAVGLRHLLDLSLSVDHRVVDGAPASRFAAELRRQLEDALVFDEV